MKENELKTREGKNLSAFFFPAVFFLTKIFVRPESLGKKAV